MSPVPSTNADRRAFVAALHRRVGDATVDTKTTYAAYVAKDLGWDASKGEGVLGDLVRSGLVTAPTRSGAIGLTQLGLAAARHPASERDDEED